jgi:hypothetical protein
MIKMGSALSSPMTSSMRNFGASRDKRRPDVRFCGVEAAGEEGLGLTASSQMFLYYALARDVTALQSILDSEKTQQALRLRYDRSTALSYSRKIPPKPHRSD